MSLRSLIKLVVGAVLSAGLGGILYYGNDTPEWWIALALAIGASITGLIMWLLSMVRVRIEPTVQARKEPVATNGEATATARGDSTPANEASSIQDTGRVFIQRTPAELANIVKGKTSIESKGIIERYTGCWLRVHGKVNDVVERRRSIVVYVEDPQDISGPFITLTFDDKKWYKALRILTVGELIKSSGEIEELGGFTLSLKHCELEA